MAIEKSHAQNAPGGNKDQNQQQGKKEGQQGFGQGQQSQQRQSGQGQQGGQSGGERKKMSPEDEETMGRGAGGAKSTEDRE